MILKKSDKIQISKIKKEHNLTCTIKVYQSQQKTKEMHTLKKVQKWMMIIQMHINQHLVIKKLKQNQVNIQRSINRCMLMLVKDYGITFIKREKKVDQ